MQRRIPSTVAFFFWVAIISPPLFGANSVGTTLLESPSARSSAMGDAIGADRRDIASLAFNPAALTALDSTQASLLYHRGLADDGYGAVLFGHDFRSAAMGLAAGLYDGGEATPFDGITERTVTAQRDLVATMGLAVPRGRMSIGAAVKYFSSEIAESAKGSAVAFDLGVRTGFRHTFSVGAAIQNIGGKVTYLRTEHPLPQLYRLSGAYEFGLHSLGGTIVADVRHFDQGETEPAAGVEIWNGPLAMRAGYRFSDRVDAFSAGAGLTFGSMSVDYAFGLASELDDRHRVSLSMAFAGGRP